MKNFLEKFDLAYLNFIPKKIDKEVITDKTIDDSIVKSPKVKLTPEMAVQKIFGRGK